MHQPSWKPGANFEVMRQRVYLYSQIRAFFAIRGFLEVETPILATSSTLDPMIALFSTHYDGPNPGTLYLQTSPELAMKRLLAAGSGPIFQISRVFRNGEAGRWHNPEFTLLEWYRPGFNHHDLMNEVEDLLRLVLGYPLAARFSYVEIFLQHLGLHPLESTLADCQARVRPHLAHANTASDLDRDTCLQLLMSHEIGPRLGYEAPVFIYDYPATQAALARRRPDHPELAERFEVYVKGIELANGFHELTDPLEQRSRFEAELVQRQQLGLESPPLDENFLAALNAGLPATAGVALGVDRLLMLMSNSSQIQEVLTFAIDRA